MLQAEGLSGMQLSEEAIDQITNQESFQQFLDRLAALPEVIPPEPNFFDIGGSGYLENPTSDLLAIFMGSQPGVPRWLAKALLACLREEEGARDLRFEEIVWEEVVAEREVSERDFESDTYKRLDILVFSDQFVLGIENKVYSGTERNPFDVYDRLLINRAGNLPIVRCILRPSSNCGEVHSSWPVISYGKLVQMAFALFGEDIAIRPINKWQFFYTEFLQHLQFLDDSKRYRAMNKNSITFVEENFHQLCRAQELLDEFEQDLLNEGQELLKSKFDQLGVDSNIRTAAHSWPNGHRALRFHPQHWGNKSNVVLIYFDNSEDSVAESQMGYYLRAYVWKDSAKRPLNTIKNELDKAIKDGSNAWVNQVDDDFCWYESKGDWLCVGVYGKDCSREGSLNALTELALWLQGNTFT